MRSGSLLVFMPTSLVHGTAHLVVSVGIEYQVRSGQASISALADLGCHILTCYMCCIWQVEAGPDFPCHALVIQSILQLQGLQLITIYTYDAGPAYTFQSFSDALT